ncbi:MAG TPA: spermidine/putrescine ABC transporter substrate-binding protein [Solirubrobacteraceae bacterium]|jgi:spermidine/putrescine transport system substrate-binding protein|nr:spermidine/putrescine ABC transporter substrate-binding protein [Solirubrobacteraceae bacterium]
MTDPRFERALEEYLEAQRLSRRRFLGRAGSAGLAVSGLSTLLAACGGVEGTSEKASEDTAKKAESVSHPETEIGNWTFSNWPLYMDKKVLRDFNRKYGGKVRYLEDINDNYEFFGKVRQQLEQGDPIGRDLVALTTYMTQRWIRNGYAEPIDKKNVPNASNLADNLKSVTHDPERKFTLPFQSGAIGLGYNIKKTGRELTSVKDFFDPKFKGQVTMLSEPYDAASTVLVGDGVDASKATLDQLLGAIEKIDKANQDGQFRRFTGNDYTTDLAKGNVAVSMAYSGDVVSLQSDNPDLRFAYPEEGNVIFTDELMMPTGVEHAYAAETMMNYLYEPAVAATLAAYINYISPVKGAQEVLRERDPEIAENELIFPPAEVQARFQSYPALEPADEREMQEAMAKVVGA